VRPVLWLVKNMKPGELAGYAAGLALSAVTAALVVTNPYYARRLIDEVITPQNKAPLIPILVTMLLLTLLRLGLRYLMVVILEIRSTESLTETRRRMYDVVQNQDYKFLSKVPTGNLMTRMTSDLELLRHTLAWISYQTVDAVTLFTTALVFFITINWRLALTLAALTPVILALSYRFVKVMRPLFMQLRERLTKLGDVVTENIDGNRVVKAFAREEFEIEKFEARNAEFRDLSVKNAYVSAKYQPLLELLSQILLPLTLGVGGLFLIRGDMTSGEYLAFSSLSWALAGPLRMLGILLADLQRFYAAAKMIIEVVDSKPEIADQPGAIRMTRPAGSIEFRDVNFTINGADVLKDINFTVAAGDTVGILGSTGAGKTSLVNMLLRFYEPTSGAVFIDGVDVRKYTLSSLRRHIGLAMQEVFLFSDTVKANIAYGRPRLEDSVIFERAKQADADGFIRRMEDGYDTLVGERGVGLSGGQRQRIALARALAVKPAILILDDTTSAVDSETEAYIREQLENIDFPCTKIIIAARVMSFKGAKEILVMDKGQIIERGNEESLLRIENGFYRRIHDLQHGRGA